LRNFIIVAGVIGIAAVTAAWAADPKVEPGKATAGEAARPAGPGLAVPLEGIHNAFWFGQKIISGSCPEGEAGFKALAQQGVKTVISVDGARPDEKLATKYGMRYVHVPITYSGITRDQSLVVARAVRDLQGPVFIHCHHGKHRGPTAAVIAAMVNEGWTTEQAQGAMKQAGTAPAYTGLWAAVRTWEAPTKAEIDKTDATFPASVKVGSTATAMISLDEMWEHVNEVRTAGWKPSPAHPDIDPPHQALLIRESFREMLRTTETKNRPADYMKKMADAEIAAAALEAALRGQDVPKAQKAYDDINKLCKSCHVGYRDNVPPVAN